MQHSVSPTMFAMLRHAQTETNRTSQALWLKIFQGWPKQQTIIIRNMWSTRLRKDENSREMLIVLNLMQTGSSINNAMSQGREISGFLSHLLNLILYQTQGTMHQTSTKFTKYYFIFISSPKVVIGKTINRVFVQAQGCLFK